MTRALNGGVESELPSPLVVHQICLRGVGGSDGSTWGQSCWLRRPQVVQRRKGRFSQYDGVFGWIEIYDIALAIHSRTSKRIWSSLVPPQSA